jgi:hypothetical protein
MTERVRKAGIYAVFAATLFLCPASDSWAQENSTLFYTVAHQDDWQLFMNPNAYHDARVADNSKVVFIYLTAGDASNGRGPLDGRRTPYYLARELGAYRATQFVATRPGDFAAAWRMQIRFLIS